MKYEVIEGTPSTEILKEIARLEEACFDLRKYDEKRLRYELDSQNNVLTILASNENEYVGYKIGYERRSAQFYSWQGGVHPSYRGQGIARELMKEQHKALKDKGYTRVRTQTGNEFKSMLLLNIKSGFDIIGTFLNRKGSIRIMLEKDI